MLGLIGSAMRTAAQAVDLHHGDPVSAAVAGAWEPVSVEYARVLAATGAGW